MPVIIQSRLDKLHALIAATVPGAEEVIAISREHNTSETYQIKFLEDFIQGEKGNRWKPVPIEVFLRDKYYLGMGDELYPEILPYIQEINSGRYVEALLTGGIGSAKTTVAVLTNAIQIYYLSCLKNPHAVYGMDRSSEIELIFQSITAKLAEAVDFARFRELITKSEYFQTNFPFDKTIKSELRFPNRIIVKPVSGSSLATIGQNVMGGLIDELNYMQTVEASKKTHDEGNYDQAVALYNSIFRRRLSRFMKQGKLPGILCLVSSKKYPGQFTDQKEEEAKTNPAIYVYDKRVWDIKPHAYGPERFKVFVGDEFRRPRILEEGEILAEADQKKITEVPMEFLEAYKKDVVDSLREISGVSHLAKSPFFTNPEPLHKVFSSTKLSSVFSRDEVDFVSSKLQIVKKNLRNLQYPRFAHVDLGLTGDAAGIAIGYCPGFLRTNREGHVEIMPRVVIDGVLRVCPPKGGEIQFEKIRKVFYILRSLGMELKWVSYDSYQSVDSMQLLRTRGFKVGQQSMDKTMVPYDFLKSAIYDGRVLAPAHPFLFGELRDLQVNHKDQKVDHLPSGSKDLSDSLAGVVYGITCLRDTWAFHEQPINESVVAAVLKKAKEQDKVARRHAASGAETADA